MMGARARAHSHPWLYPAASYGSSRTRSFVRCSPSAQQNLTPRWVDRVFSVTDLREDAFFTLRPDSWKLKATGGELDDHSPRKKNSFIREKPSDKLHMPFIMVTLVIKIRPGFSLVSSSQRMVRHNFSYGNFSFLTKLTASLLHPEGKHQDTWFCSR